MNLTVPRDQDTALTAQIARSCDLSGGTVGVAALHPGTGRRFEWNANEPFPMASTFKIVVACTVLKRVDSGTLSLDMLISIPEDLRVGSEGIDTLLPHPGLQLSVRNLLEVMLTLSDNTATDVLMQTLGGAQPINAWLRDLGIAEQRVDRNTAGLIRDFFDLPASRVLHQPHAAAAKDLPDIIARADRPNPTYDEDPRDTTTPNAMLELLLAIDSGKALNEASTRFLFEVLSRCATGNARLRALLPPGTTVADKTGTLGGTCNDVGIVVLPDGSHMAIAVFIKKSACAPAQRERAIAEIARTFYDACLLTR